MSKSIESQLLQAAVRSHEQALNRLEAIVEGLSDGQASWQPEPKKWSVLECIEHLNQTLGTYLERMAPAIERARDQGRVGAEPYGRGTLAGRLLVGFLERPTKKTRAPGVFQPAPSGLEVGEVAETFRDRVARFIDLAGQADGLDLGAIKIATPVSDWIRLSLAQAFQVHTLHTPRHLDQAEHLKQHPDFPA